MPATRHGRARPECRPAAVNRRHQPLGGSLPAGAAATPEPPPVHLPSQEGVGLSSPGRRPAARRGRQPTPGGRCARRRSATPSSTARWRACRRPISPSWTSRRSCACSRRSGPGTSGIASTAASSRSMLDQQGSVLAAQAVHLGAGTVDGRSMGTQQPGAGLQRTGHGPRQRTDPVRARDGTLRRPGRPRLLPAGRRRGPRRQPPPGPASDSRAAGRPQRTPGSAGCPGGTAAPRRHASPPTHLPVPAAAGSTCR